MPGFKSDFRLRLLQRGIALAGAIILFGLGFVWSCGASAMLMALSSILSEEWFRFLLILYAASVVLYLMKSDLLEYFLWKKGLREKFQPVQRGLWAWEIKKKPEPLSIEFYEATIQSHIVIVLPLTLGLLVVFFRFYSRSFCVQLP